MKAFAAVTAALIAGTDLGIKQYIEKHLHPAEERSVFRDRIRIRKVHNHGMMLNRLEKHPLLVKLTSAMALGALLLWQTLVRKKPGHVPEQIGMAMMTGGAVSNTADRICRGYVVDYLAFRCRNKKAENVTYNLGDFAIFGGAVLIIIGALTGKE